MDKGWMHPTVSRCSREYILGCKDFLKFAWANRQKESGDEIYCPCVLCLNKVLRPMNIVESHILEYGFLRTYVNWTMHGEIEEKNPHNAESISINDMRTMLLDAFKFPHIPNQPNLNESGPSGHGPSTRNKEVPKFFHKRLKPDKPRYPGTKLNLPILVRLCRMRNNPFDMMLEVLKDHEKMQCEIVEMRRQAQEKEEQRQHEFDQMKRRFEAQAEEMQRNFDEQTAVMEARIHDTLMQRAASVQNPSKRPRNT